MRAYTHILLLLTAGLGFVNAAPAKRQLTGCDVSNAVIPLPAGQTALSVPAGLKPVYVAAGLGEQNYTCTTAGTYSSIGAVAKLFDASCFVNEFTQQDPASPASLARFGGGQLTLGEHYFIKNPITGTGISPKFDFSSDSQKSNPTAFIVASKTGAIPSPTNPTTNVGWLELAAMPGTTGTLAKTVFRIDTRGGQPPAKCTAGSPPITVPYMALYWFFN